MDCSLRNILLLMATCWSKAALLLQEEKETSVCPSRVSLVHETQWFITITVAAFVVILFERVDFPNVVALQQQASQV